MPEGDTVFRTAARMHAAMSGRVLLRTEFRWPTLGAVDLTGRTVLETVPYGKQILTRFDAGADVPVTLRSHLRMDGRWSIAPPGPAHWPTRIGPSVRAILANQDWTAIGTWLGLLDLVPTAQEGALIGHLGPDIMADSFVHGGMAEGVRRISAWPDRPIGAALLDQTGVAGIGTMYMAESLFLEHLSPWMPVSEVDVARTLARARRLLLNGATSAVPTTTGNEQNGRRTYTHARSGRPCFRCGTTVRVAAIGVAPKERTAFYCPQCQPGPTPTDDGRPQQPLGSSRTPTRPASSYRR